MAVIIPEVNFQQICLQLGGQLVYNQPRLFDAQALVNVEVLFLGDAHRPVVLMAGVGKFQHVGAYNAVLFEVGGGWLVPAAEETTPVFGAELGQEAGRGEGVTFEETYLVAVENGAGVNVGMDGVKGFGAVGAKILANFGLTPGVVLGVAGNVVDYPFDGNPGVTGIKVGVAGKLLRGYGLPGIGGGHDGKRGRGNIYKKAGNIMG